MSKKLTSKIERRERRRLRVRTRVSGTAEKPRLNLHRSIRGAYAQLIDDDKSKTLLGLHSKKIDKKCEAGERKGKVASAYRLGKILAEKAKAVGIGQVVFDRAGYRYHGRLKALADGARDGGLKF